ncbi:MAG: hypothetical protein ACOZNI_23620 [Myxococcota bacterium]
MIALLIACAGLAAATPPPPPEPPVATPLKPPPPVAFEDGPSVADPAALLAWLEAGKGRLVQLPVVVAFDDKHRLGVARAWVGDDEVGLRLHLDDTAMGVALIDHLRRDCPKGPTCAVWLEGTWGPLMPGLPDFGEDPSRHPFSVKRYVGLAGADATRARGAKP